MAPKDGTSRLMANNQAMVMVNNKDMTSHGDNKVMGSSNNKDTGSSSQHGEASSSKVMVRLQDMDSNRDMDNPHNRAMMAHNKDMDSSKSKDGNKMKSPHQGCQTQVEILKSPAAAMDMVHLRRPVATMQDMDNKVVLEAKLKLQQVEEEEEDQMVQVEDTIHTSAENTHTSYLHKFVELRHFCCK